VSDPLSDMLEDYEATYRCAPRRLTCADRDRWRDLGTRSGVHVVCMYKVGSAESKLAIRITHWGGTPSRLTNYFAQQVDSLI
jgi:hypothetical protein